jgi:hypothetical protein
MIGSWFPSLDMFVVSVIRFVAVFVVLYFLAIVIYWFNRAGKVPSLRVIWRTMIQLARWFPKILVHRIRIVPARIRKKSVSAYPELKMHSTAFTRSSAFKSSRRKKNTSIKAKKKK